MARREDLRRPHRAVAIPARSSQHQGRHRGWIFSRRLRGRVDRLGGLHLALGARAGVVRLWSGSVRRCARQRLAARPEGRGGRGGGASRARYDALAGARPRSRDGCRRCRGDCSGFPNRLGPDRGDHSRLLRRGHHASCQRSGRSRVAAVEGRPAGAVLLTVFFAILLGLPLLIAVVPNHSLQLFEAFYRAGSLVFGGGHVVLPLLQASVVPPGWVSNDAFLAGYGAAQAVPGPLFTFAAYLGAVMGPQPNGWIGATLCLVAVFLPSFLLVVGTLPFWDSLRRLPAAQSVLRGVNAAVVGLLLAALYNPVWTSGITSGADFVLAFACFLLLFMWQVPPWLVVVLSAIGGAVIAKI